MTEEVIDNKPFRRKAAQAAAWRPHQRISASTLPSENRAGDGHGTRATQQEPQSTSSSTSRLYAPPPNRDGSTNSTLTAPEQTELTELAALPPVHAGASGQPKGGQTLESSRRAHHRIYSDDNSDVRTPLGKDEEALDELAAPTPAQRGDRYNSLHPKEWRQQYTPKETTSPSSSQAKPAGKKISSVATQIYIVSYLTFFAILGTLARLGTQWLAFYPGAPVVFANLWANFGGTLFMGFLSEDQRLFREEWGDKAAAAARPQDEEKHDRAAHGKVKKTIPLFVGLATGFCGSYTSFSTFMRDAFLALSNSLPSPHSHPGETASETSAAARHNGYSFLAVLAVFILTLTVNLGALKLGAHIALALDPVMPTLPFRLVRKVLDRAVVFLAVGCWLGAVFMAIWPPDRPSGPSSRGPWSNETWRGEVIFALVFAPLGCLLRFYLSLTLNPMIPSFPVGTFAANMLGTAVLSMAYDLQHVPLASAHGAIGGGRVACQVLQGVQDGFDGCLTTVSTWILELTTLKRRHAYFYGLASIGTALSIVVVILGSVRWTIGFSTPACVLTTT